MNELSEIEKSGLRGELSIREWNSIGMSLFQKGLVSLNPFLTDNASVPHFALTPAGFEVAQKLQGEQS